MIILNTTGIWHINTHLRVYTAAIAYLGLIRLLIVTSMTVSVAKKKLVTVADCWEGVGIPVLGFPA